MTLSFTTMELTQKAKDLIAKIDAKKNLDMQKLRQCKISSITIINPIYQTESLQKKAPVDLTRRKYTNWGGIDTVSNSGENKQRQPLAEDYYS